MTSPAASPSPVASDPAGASAIAATSAAAPPFESRPLLIVAVVALIVYGGAFGYVCWDHVTYPGFVEPMEGSALQHIERFATGRTPYPTPSEEFIGLSYMPLYYMTAVPLYRLMGDSFAGPRLVSVISALLSGLLVAWIAWRESRSRTVTCLAAALYAASYRVMDAWLTCELPDSLLLFWILLGYGFWAYGRRAWHDVAWLTCFTLAFWTKQHGALFFGCAVLYALVLRRNALPKWSLVLGLLLGGPVAYALLGPLFGEGFFQQTLTMPGEWQRSVWLSVRRTAFVLIEFVPFAGLLTLWHWIGTTKLRPLAIPPLTWFSCTSLVAIAATMMASGSSNNHYIPFLAIVCVTASLAVGRIATDGPPRGTLIALAVTVALSTGLTVYAVRSYGYHPIPKFVPAVVAVAFVAACVVAFTSWSAQRKAIAVATLLVIGQLGCDFYYVPDFVSARGALAGIEDLRAEIAALDGPVIWYPYGNAPRAATGIKIAVAPSAIEYEDVDRREADPETIRRDLEPYRRRLVESNPLYILSNGRLDDAAGLPNLPDRWELLRDYGTRFASVRQVTVHWFGGGEYPRYLYRGRPRVAATTAAASDRPTPQVIP